jgi:hypothetical protein
MSRSSWSRTHLAPLTYDSQNPTRVTALYVSDCERLVVKDTACLASFLLLPPPFLFQRSTHTQRHLHVYRYNLQHFFTPTNHQTHSINTQSSQQSTHHAPNQTPTSYCGRLLCLDQAHRNARGEMEDIPLPPARPALRFREGGPTTLSGRAQSPRGSPRRHIRPEQRTATNVRRVERPRNGEVHRVEGNSE